MPPRELLGDSMMRRGAITFLSCNSVATGIPIKITIEPEGLYEFGRFYY